MNDDQKNSGTEIVHGIERKFGIAVLTIVFMILFFGGAFLLWERNHSLEERRDLLAESGQLEALLASTQESLAKDLELRTIEKIDFEQYQTIALDNGDLYVGKVVEEKNNQLTVDQPVRLTQTAAEPEEPARKQLKMSRDNVSYLRNLSKDSRLLNAIRGAIQ